MSELRPMGPLAADHPAVGERCHVCGEPIGAGEVVTLIPHATDPNGPKWQTVAADLAHWECARPAPAPKPRG